MVKSVIRRNSRSLRHVVRPKGSRRRRNKRSKKMRGGGNILTLTTPTNFEGIIVPRETVKLVKYEDKIFTDEKINYIYIVVKDNDMEQIEYFQLLIDLHFVQEEAEQYKTGMILKTYDTVTEGEHSNKKKYKYILPNCENVNQQIDKSTSCKDILYNHINNYFEE